MAKPFNLTAQLNLVGPTNLRPVVNNLRKQLSGINTNVTVNVSRGAARNVGVLDRSVQALTKSLQQANAQAKTLSATMASLSKSLTNIANQSSKASSNLNNTANTANNVAKNVGQAATQMEEFGRVSGLALRRYAGFTVATSLTFGFVRAVSNAVTEAVKFERELVKVAQVSGNSTKSLRSLTDEIGRLSTTLGVSSSELLEVSRTLSQAGLSAIETKRALDALAKSALAPTFNDIRNTTEGVIAVMSQFGIGARNIEKVLGSLNAVAGKFAVEAEDLISVIRRTGGVFKAAAGDVGTPIQQLNELIAVFTSVRSTTRESAESIATGLRTIFTRIQRPSTLKFLNQLGVNLQDLEGKFVGPFKAMQLLNQALVSLDPRDVRYAKIVEQLGGFRQVGKLIPAIQQFAKAQEALGVAVAGQGSLAKDAQTAQQSLLVQTQRVREEFLKLFRDIAGDSTFQLFAKGALGLASSLIKLADSFRPILPMLTALATIKAGSALKQFGTGFFGGLRSGGGAQAVGQNLASGATGSGSATASQALQNITKANTIAIQANTKATIANNIALNALLRTQVGLRPARPMPAAPRPRVRPRLGGQIYPRHFNSGGFVPGTGNYDSVPAMLTPGEFVVKKSAAQALGPDYLHSMNRKQRGGKIRRQRFAEGGPVFVVDPNDEMPYGGLGYNIEAKPGATRGKKGGSAISRFDSGALTTLWNKTKNDSNMRKLVSGNPDNLTEEEFKREIKSSGSISGNPALRGLTPNMRQTFTDSFTGSMDKTIDGFLQDAFDMGVEVMASKLGGEPSKDELFKSIKKEMQPETLSGLFFQGFTQAFTRTKVDDDSGQARWDADTSQGPELYDRLFGKGTSSIKDWDNKNTLDSNKVIDIVAKALGTGRDVEVQNTSQFEEYVTRAGKTAAARQAGAAQPKKAAMGGSISGSDTVPALLTPGEFVINRESASRIGLANLNRMNQGKIKGYNSGGLVMGAMMGAPMVGAMVGGAAGDATSAGVMGAAMGLSMVGEEASKLSKGLAFAAVGAYSAADAYIKAAKELERVEAQEKLDKAGDKVAGILEKFGNTISEHTYQLERSFQQMNEAIQTLNLVQQGPQGVIQTLRQILGTSSAQAIRQENEVGLTNILLAQTLDAIIGGNRAEELRMRGEEMSIRRQAQTGRPAAEQARQTLMAQFRERAMRQIAAGEDPLATTTADNNFVGRNQQQLIAIANGEEDIIRLRRRLEDSAESLGLTEEQINRKVHDAVMAKVRAMEEEAERLAIAEKAQQEFNDTIDVMSRRFSGIAGVAKRVGAEMELLNGAMQDQINAAKGQAAVNLGGNQFSAVLTNMEGFTQDEIKSTVGALGATAGLSDNAEFAGLANVVTTTSSLQAELPQLIQDALVASGGPLADNFSSILEDSILSFTGADANDPFIAEMLNAITSSLEVGEARGSDVGQAAIENLVNSALESLSQRAELAGKAMEEIAKVVDDQMKRFGEAINTQTGLIMAANAAQERVNQIRFRQEQQMAELTGKPLTLEQMFAPFESQLAALTGGLTNVNEIANQRAILEAESKNIANELGTRGKTPKELERLGSEAARVNAALNETHAALELLANDTSRQSAIVQKLNKLNEARSGAKNIMEAILTGDPQELMKFTRGMNLVAAQQGGMLNTSMIGNDDRALLFQMFKMLQPLAGADAGLGIPEDAFSTGGLIGAMMGDFGLNGGPAMAGFNMLATTNKGESNQERILLDKLATINQEQIQAAQTLAGIDRQIQREHSAHLANMPTLFAVELANQIKTIVDEINIQHQGETAAVTGVGAPAGPPANVAIAGPDGNPQFLQPDGTYGPNLGPSNIGTPSGAPGVTGNVMNLGIDPTIDPQKMNEAGGGNGTRNRPFYIGTHEAASTDLATGVHGITDDGTVYVGLKRGGGLLDGKLIRKRRPDEEILERLAGKTVPGVGNTDKVAALLTPEEYVVNKQASVNNRDILETINALGASRKFRLVAANQGGVMRYQRGGAAGTTPDYGVNIPDYGIDLSDPSRNLIDQAINSALQAFDGYAGTKLQPRWNDLSEEAKMLLAGGSALGTVGLGLGAFRGAKGALGFASPMQKKIADLANGKQLNELNKRNFSFRRTYSNKAIQKVLDFKANRFSNLALSDEGREVLLELLKGRGVKPSSAATQTKVPKGSPKPPKPPAIKSPRVPVGGTAPGSPGVVNPRNAATPTRASDAAAKAYDSTITFIKRGYAGASDLFNNVVTGASNTTVGGNQGIFSDKRFLGKMTNSVDGFIDGLLRRHLPSFYDLSENTLGKNLEELSRQRWLKRLNSISKPLQSKIPVAKPPYFDFPGLEGTSVRRGAVRFNVAPRTPANVIPRTPQRPVPMFGPAKPALPMQPGLYRPALEGLPGFGPGGQPRTVAPTGTNRFSGSRTPAPNRVLTKTPGPAGRIVRGGGVAKTAAGAAASAATFVAEATTYAVEGELARTEYLDNAARAFNLYVLPALQAQEDFQKLNLAEQNAKIQRERNLYMQPYRDAAEYLAGGKTGSIGGGISRTAQGLLDVGFMAVEGIQEIGTLGGAETYTFGNKEVEQVGMVKKAVRMGSPSHTAYIQWKRSQGIFNKPVFFRDGQRAYNPTGKTYSTPVGYKVPGLGERMHEMVRENELSAVSKAGGKWASLKPLFGNGTTKEEEAAIRRGEIFYDTPILKSMVATAASSDDTLLGTEKAKARTRGDSKTARQTIAAMAKKYGATDEFSLTYLLDNSASDLYNKYVKEAIDNRIVTAGGGQNYLRAWAQSSEPIPFDNVKWFETSSGIKDWFLNSDMLARNAAKTVAAQVVAHKEFVDAGAKATEFDQPLPEIGGQFNGFSKRMYEELGLRMAGYRKFIEATQNPDYMKKRGFELAFGPGGTLEQTIENNPSLLRFGGIEGADSSWAAKAEQSQALFDFVKSRGTRHPVRSSGAEMKNVPLWFDNDNPAGEFGKIIDKKNGNAIYGSKTFAYGGQFPFNFTKQDFGGSLNEQLLDKSNEKAVRGFFGANLDGIGASGIFLKGIPHNADIKTGPQAQLFTDSTKVEYAATELLQGFRHTLKSVGMMAQIEADELMHEHRVSNHQPHPSKLGKPETEDLRKQMSEFLYTNHLLPMNQNEEQGGIFRVSAGMLAQFNVQALRDLEKKFRNADNGIYTDVYPELATNQIKQKLLDRWLDSEATRKTYENGGMIGGRKHSAGGTIVEAERGEYIVNAQSTAKNRGLLEAINSGRGKNGLNKNGLAMMAAGGDPFNPFTGGQQGHGFRNDILAIYNQANELLAGAQDEIAKQTSSAEGNILEYLQQASNRISRDFYWGDDKGETIPEFTGGSTMDGVYMDQANRYVEFVKKGLALEARAFEDFIKNEQDAETHNRRLEQEKTRKSSVMRAGAFSDDKAAAAQRAKQVKAGNVGGTADEIKAFVQTGASPASIAGPGGGTQVRQADGSFGAASEPIFQLPSGEKVPMSQLPRGAQRSIQAGTSRLQQVGMTGGAVAGGGAAGRGAGAAGRGAGGAGRAAVQRDMPEVAGGGGGALGGAKVEELLQKIIDTLTGGDKALVEAFKNRGGAGGAGGPAGGEFAAFAETMRQSAATLTTAFEQFGTTATTIREAADIFNTAADKITQAAQSLASIPETFTHKHDMSVTISNETGFADALATSIQDKVAEQVFDRVKNLLPQTDTRGETFGV